MNQVISDFQFWLGIIFIIVGFIMFKLIDKSFAKQKDRLENPRQNFKKYQHEMFEKGFLMRSHTIMGYICPAFIMIMGIIILIVTLAKY